MRLSLRPIVILALALLPTLGCAVQPTNPSFPLTTSEARADLTRMAAGRHKFQRPLVIIGGIWDVGYGPLVVQWRLDQVTEDRRITTIELAECWNLDSCRRKVIEVVEKEFPSSDLAETTEVDVVGLSMGGLVARYAALDDSRGTGVSPVSAELKQQQNVGASPVSEKEHGLDARATSARATTPTTTPSAPPLKRLKIARLFTVSSPHLGAVDAEIVPGVHPLIRELRPGSDIVNKVNAAKSNYPIVPYVRLNDRPVGVDYAAPPGQTPWWVSTPMLNDPHCGSFMDERIMADIARRLRGETPWTVDPPAPLPAKG